MRKPVIINFTQKQLDSFVEDPNSCVTINNTTYSIPLYPYHISNISESIKRLLNAKVAKYDQRLDGILLGYKNLKLLTPYASLRADSCYIHADIQGEFYIFKPKVGVKLTGIVNKTSSNHIGCLVHKVFNVSVPNKNESEEESWAGFEVKIGSTVVLSVTQIQLDARLPYIQASIISSSNSSIIEKENEKIKETPKKHKKITDRDIELLIEEGRKQKEKREAEKIEKELQRSILNGSAKKEKKNRKSEEVENFVTLEEKTPNLSDSTKKEKRKRKSETLEVKTPNLSDSTKKEKKERKSDIVESFVTLEGKTPNLNDSTKKEKKKRKSDTNEQKTPNQDSTKKEKKKQKSETIKNPAVRNEGPTKQPKKQKNKNSQLDISKNLETQIKLEELSQKTLILNESQKKSNTNKISPKKTKIPNDSQRTNESDYFATPKIKKKQKQLKTPEVEANLEKGSLEDFIPKEKKTKSSAEKKKKNKQTETTIEELQNTLLNEKLHSLIESQKKEKKRKSKEAKPEKLLNLSPIKPMADLEDRKIKKRRPSLTQTVDWENKNLKLYDSDLEKTLNTPTDNNKSLQFNLAKIQALNDDTPRKRKRKLLPADDFIECIDKKRRRMYED